MLLSQEQKIKIDEFLKNKKINYKIYSYKNLDCKIEFQENVTFEIIDSLCEILGVKKSSIVIKAFNNSVYIIIK